MPCADYPYLTFFSIELQQRFGQHFDGGRGCFLDEEVALSPMFEGIEHEIDGIFERHHEPGHVRIRYRDGLTFFYLLDEQRYHRSPGGHHIAISRSAKYGLGVIQVPRSCYH